MIDFHSHLFHKCRNLQSSLLLQLYVPMVHKGPDPVIPEKDLPHQMSTHWQCGGPLYLSSSWVKPDTFLYILRVAS